MAAVIKRTRVHLKSTVAWKLHSVSSVKEKSITASLEEQQLAFELIVPLGLVLRLTLPFPHSWISLFT